MLDFLDESKLEFIYEAFGHDRQILKLIEELNELSRELSRYAAGISDKKNVASEIADVLILIGQMEDEFDENMILDEIDNKIATVLCKIEKGEYECLSENVMLKLKEMKLDMMA